MAPGPETRLVGRITKAILAEYPQAVIYKIHGGEFQEAGIPDLVACVDGQFIGLEVKFRRPGESAEHAHDRASVLQRRQIDRIKRAGGTAGVVLSPEDALSLIHRALDDQENQSVVH